MRKWVLGAVMQADQKVWEESRFWKALSANIYNIKVRLQTQVDLSHLH